MGGRSPSHHIDAATNRPASLGGGQGVGLAYHANGSLSRRGVQGFGFDIANRLHSATGKAGYSYDGRGRRIRALYADGSSKLQVYSQGGRLLYSLHGSQRSTRHGHTDALGSPVALTSAAGSAQSGTAGLVTTRYDRPENGHTSVVRALQGCPTWQLQDARTTRGWLLASRDERADRRNSRLIKDSSPG